MKNDFIRCGLTGWCLEIFWTAMGKLRKHDAKLMGQTSLLMFPIYGMAAVIRPVHKKIKQKNFIVRGSIYMACIYAAEYTTGMLLKKRKMCPWDYSRSRYNINGVVRLDYAPVWFVVGLIYERILK